MLKMFALIIGTWNLLNIFTKWMQNYDKLQGIFNLHVSLFVSFSYDVSFFSGSIPQFSLTSIYIVMSDFMTPIFPKCASKWEFF